MYTIEERSYGLKITLEEMPNNEDLRALSAELKTQLRSRVRRQKERIISLIVRRNADGAADSAPMIYVFDA